LKIVNIDSFPIYPRIAERYKSHGRTHDYYSRMFYRVTTDNGIVGYGDYDWEGARQKEPKLDRIVDRNPFDFLNNNFNPGLGMTLYDVMGKYLEVPAYKLMGQKVRDGVTVAAWTGSCTPALYREEIKRAVALGYMVFKMHMRGFWDVMEHIRMAEEVAPPGFKLHFDFNGNRTMGGVLDLVNRMEQHPIVGFIEDPFPNHALDDWRRLREKSRIPIVMHKNPLSGYQEALTGVADIYMIGDGYPTCSIGDTLSRGNLYSRANIQTIMQMTGGTLGKALALHMAAVLPSATGHSINLEDQCDDDVATKKIPIIEGFSPVPEGPGLGVNVDEAAIKRLSAPRPQATTRRLGITYMPGGKKLYTPSNPDLTRITGWEEGTVRGADFEYWFDDGSKEFAAMHARVAAGGPQWE